MKRTIVVNEGIISFLANADKKVTAIMQAKDFWIMYQKFLGKTDQKEGLTSLLEFFSKAGIDENVIKKKVSDWQKRNNFKLLNSSTFKNFWNPKTKQAFTFFKDNYSSLKRSVDKVTKNNDYLSNVNFTDTNEKGLVKLFKYLWVMDFIDFNPQSGKVNITTGTKNTHAYNASSTNLKKLAFDIFYYAETESEKIKKEEPPATQETPKNPEKKKTTVVDDKTKKDDSSLTQKEKREKATLGARLQKLKSKYPNLQKMAEKNNFEKLTDQDKADLMSLAALLIVKNP